MESITHVCHSFLFVVYLLYEFLMCFKADFFFSSYLNIFHFRKWVCPLNNHSDRIFCAYTVKPLHKYFCFEHG